MGNREPLQSWGCSGLSPGEISCCLYRMGILRENSKPTWAQQHTYRGVSCELERLYSPSEQEELTDGIYTSVRDDKPASYREAQ